MKTLLTRALHIGIAGIGASIFMTWVTVLLVGFAGLQSGVPADASQVLRGFLGLLSFGLYGMLVGVAGGAMATALCLAPTLILLHYAEKRHFGRALLLTSGAIMGSISGAGFVAMSNSITFSSNDLALPILCALGGVVAAEIYVRLDRMWLGRRSRRS